MAAKLICVQYYSCVTCMHQSLDLFLLYRFYAHATHNTSWSPHSLAASRRQTTGGPSTTATASIYTGKAGPQIYWKADWTRGWCSCSLLLPASGALSSIVLHFPFILHYICHILCIKYSIMHSSQAIIRAGGSQCHRITSIVTKNIIPWIWSDVLIDKLWVCHTS